MSWWQRFKKSSAHTQANIVCTVLIMAATIAYAVVAARQLAQMRHTNELTQTALNGSNESLTKTLNKMQGQVDATNTLAGYAKDQADKAAVLTANSGIQAKASQESADAAQRNADIAKDAMNANIESLHREDQAWVGIASAKPHSFGVDPTTHNANMQVAFTLRNYGRSAAENIRFLAVLESDPAINTLSCDELEKIHATMVLLPTQEQTMNWVMHLTPEQIAQGWAHQNPVAGKILLLKVVGCIDYTDRENEHPPHRTPFSYLVLPNQASYITLDTTFTEDQFRLEPMFEDAGHSQVH